MDFDGETERGAVSFGPFSLYPGERLLTRDGAPVRLGSRALDVLIVLVERAGDVVSNKYLVERVWPNITVDESSLRVHVAGLRKALGDGRGAARYVTNVPGRGYCFVAPVSRLMAGAVPHVVLKKVGRVDARLPGSLTRMIGRDDTVKAISEQLATDRFVTIVGAGGMGKTTVAIAVAHGLLPEFGEAVAFFDLGSLTDPRLVAGTVAATLGLIVQASDPISSLAAALAERKLLLILDNCEHVISTVAPLAEMIFAETTDVHILATSRESLRVEGEHVYRLDPLESPGRNTGLIAAEAMRFPAVQLFVERAAASGTSLELTDPDAQVVGEICNSLGGVALAIELAASRVNAHGLRETAALLGNRFGLHWQGRRTAVPRHQTLNAMLDWSYKLLPEAERTILRRLSIFVGAFGLEAAGEVAAGGEGIDMQVADVLASLVEKSLVSMNVVGSHATYRLLETTRAYALEKLAEGEEVDAVSERHALYFTRLLMRPAGRDATIPVSGRTAISETLGNVRSALKWCFSAQGNGPTGTALAALATPFFLDLSLLSECLEWSERALSALADADRGTPVEMGLQETLAISSMFTKGNGDDVRAAILRGLALAETLGDSQHRLRMLAGLNIFLTRIGDFRGALAVAEKSETTARALADPAGEIMADWMLGVAHHLVGAQAAAQRHCEAGFARAVASPNVNTSFFGYDHRIRALVALTRALWLRGYPDQALVLAQQALDEAAEHDQPVSTCISLIYTAPVFIWCGDFRKATDLANRLIAHAKRHLLTPYHAVGLGLQGELLIKGGDTETGLELLHKALNILNDEQHNLQTTTFLTAIAEGQAALERHDAALATIGAALSWSERREGSYDMPEMLRVKGSILASMSRPDLPAAEACFSQSLDIARRQATLGWELRTASSMADLRIKQGRADEGKKLLDEVYAKFEAGRDLQNAGQTRYAAAFGTARRLQRQSRRSGETTR